MVYEIIYQQPLYRNFRASSTSFAYLVRVQIRVLEILLPLIIIFTTQGLWKKFGDFREVPKVSYYGKHIFLLNSNSNIPIVSSSFPILNIAQQNSLVIAEETWYWSFPQELNLHFNFPLVNQTITSLLYIVFLDYELGYHSLIQAEVALSGTIDFSEKVQEITITGSLKAEQSQPFQNYQHQYKLIDDARQDFQHYQPSSVLKRIVSSPLAVIINRKVERILPSLTHNSSFRLSLSLHVGEDHFLYKTGAGELLKWFWIQYFAIYVIIRYLCHEILTYLLVNNIIESTNEY